MGTPLTAAKGWAAARALGAAAPRRALVVLALLLLLAAGVAVAAVAGPSSAATTPTASTGTTATAATTTTAASGALVLTGHGWGHGLGLSQWGADGYAKHGWTYQQILAHYYVGTTLGAAPASTIRVLVGSGAKVTLASTVPWTATDASGRVVSLQPGSLAVGPTMTVDGQVLAAPVTFAGTEPLSVGGTAYDGSIVVGVSGKSVEAVDHVDLESYLKGVVPIEMPSGWPAAALEAQAVAARSYALANVAKSGAFDLYGDERSQGYGGVAAETPATSAAVDATAGQVLLYDGKVADAMFFASSGGRTASAQEVLGVSIPYLQSVADPYDTLAPEHDWGPVVINLARVAKLLKTGSPIEDMEVTPSQSGRVASVSVTTEDETTDTFTGNQLESALGLRSTWFTPALLELVPPAAPVTSGAATALTGFVRGAISNVSLESKVAGGQWTADGPVPVQDGGDFAVPITPELPTEYRLAWGNLRVGLAKVAMSAAVRLTGAASGVAGTVTPVANGASVELLQRNGSIWTVIASTTLGDTSSFAFPLQLEPGSYRARYTPGDGYGVVVSAPVQVP